MIIKIINRLICLCSFALSSPILKKKNNLLKICILHCLVLLNSILFFTFFSFNLLNERLYKIRVIKRMAKVIF